MQTFKILSFLIIAAIICSCGSDDTPVLTTVESGEGLIGEWERSIPQYVWQGHNEPAKEMGETRFLLLFEEDGSFSYTTTTLGVYEGTSIDDVSSWVESSGTFVRDEDHIEFDFDKRTWWDAFYPDMTPETDEDLNIGIFMDATFKIENDVLTLSYFNRTFEGPEEHVDVFERK